MIWYAAKVSVPVGIFAGTLVETTANASDAAGTQLKIAILSTVTGIVIALIGGTALVLSTRAKQGKEPLSQDKIAVMNEAHMHLIQEQAQVIVGLIAERDEAVEERDALKEEVAKLRKQVAHHGPARRST